MRRTVQIAGGVESLFGTLDENVKLLESALHVTTNCRMAITLPSKASPRRSIAPSASSRI
jgi:hypothetical protein